MAERRWWSWSAWRTRTPVVPVIRLAGAIGGPSLRGAGLSLNAMSGALDRAFKVRHAKAVALAINCPGGSPVQSALLAGRIRALAAEKELPVLAFVEDVGASGGYWLALAADEIFADANSIIGSIGVVHASFGFADAIERLGIERRLYTAGKRKSMLDPFQPPEPDDVERIKGIMGEIHLEFKAIVRERRGDRLQAKDAELFEGQIWTGRSAQAVGLIDGLGELRSTLRARYGDKVKLPLITAGKPWWQRRLGFGVDPEAMVEQTIATLAERALWARYGL